MLVSIHLILLHKWHVFLNLWKLIGDRLAGWIWCSLIKNFNKVFLVFFVVILINRGINGSHYFERIIKKSVYERIRRKRNRADKTYQNRLIISFPSYFKLLMLVCWFLLEIQISVKRRPWLVTFFNNFFLRLLDHLFELSVCDFGILE